MRKMFESGIIQRKASMVLDEAMPFSVDQNCMENENLEKTNSFVPIDPESIKSCFTIWLLGLMVGSFVLTLELVVHYCKRENVYIH